MTEISTILLATDFSEGSARAAAMARTLSKLSGAKVVVLHVITEMSDKRSRHLPAEVIETLLHEVRKHALEDMRRFCDNNFAEVSHSTQIAVGRGDEEILSAATQEGADMIVIGTHGRTGLEKLFVGSIAEKVVRAARIPVLTVRE